MIKVNSEINYDVVVVGGGAAGVSAACGAARRGARVALFEQYGFLGGAATNSSVLAYCGFFTKAKEQVVKGIGQLFLDELDKQDLYKTHTFANTGNTVVLLDRETTKRSLDLLLTNYSVDVFHHANVFGAQLKPNSAEIESIFATHRGGIVRCSGSQFVDASGDGILAHRSGAEIFPSLPGQRQASTLVMQIGGVPEGYEPTQALMQQAVEPYNASFGTDLEVSNGTCVRSPLNGELMLLVVDEYRDVLNLHEISQAEISARTKAHQYFQAFQSYLPGFEKAWLSSTGPQIGIRESRRVKGLTTIKAEDVLDARKQPEAAIARCGWPIEDHSSRGKTSFTDISGQGWYHIPLGALASYNLKNLWVGGRLVSSDARAFASVRVMGTAFATGHAAGIAAAVSSECPREDRLGITESVQEELSKQGALI